jgi:hypothetical protein
MLLSRSSCWSVHDIATREGVRSLPGGGEFIAIASRFFHGALAAGGSRARRDARCIVLAKLADSGRDGDDGSRLSHCYCSDAISISPAVAVNIYKRRRLSR